MRSNGIFLILVDKVTTRDDILPRDATRMIYISTIVQSQQSLFIPGWRQRIRILKPIRSPLFCTFL